MSCLSFALGRVFLKGIKNLVFCTKHKKNRDRKREDMFNDMS